MPFEASSDTQFQIPDVLRDWPWPRAINPHYALCAAESTAWIESFHAFSPEAQVIFNRCNFNLFGGLAYPLHDKVGCRIACDLTNLLFVIDDNSEVSDASGVRMQVDIVMDALRNPAVPRPKEEWICGEIARQYWERGMNIASSGAQRRFIDAFQEYTDAIVQQAEDRKSNHIHSVETYFDLRRGTVAVKPLFAILEIYMNLDDVIEDTSIQTLMSKAIDMVIIQNDIYSYNIEQARGDDGHNLITIVMKELELDLHGAMKWCSDLHDELADSFLDTMKSVPSWDDPEMNVQVATYIDGLGNWVRANECWSHETVRYFGTGGEEVRRTGVVRLLPKKLCVNVSEVGVECHPNWKSNLPTAVEYE